MSKQKVLIVGGGFGGIRAALDLADDDRFAVTLLSDRPNFRYYPSLYHTATGGTRANTSIAIERIFENKDVTILQGKAESVDRETKTITTDDGRSLAYDTLILSLGVTTNYFGIKGLEQYSYSIKSVEKAERLKAHLHRQLIDERQPDLNYVVVGGGPTGIELAGALPQYIRYIMAKHGIKSRKVSISLVEAAPRILPQLPRDSSRMVRRQLRRLGVKVRLGQVVEGETADSLQISGQRIPSQTVVWTAGVTNNPFFKANGFTVTKKGKVAVNAYLQTEDGIYVIGDNANTPFSGMAQTALHDGAFVASNLKRQMDGKQPKSYTVKRPITVIPVGQRWAMVAWGKLRIYGWLGWILRQAADLIAFHDFEPWPQATRQWLTELEHEDNCSVCKAATLA